MPASAVLDFVATKISGTDVSETPFSVTVPNSVRIVIIVILFAHNIQMSDNMTNMTIHEQDRQGYEALTAILETTYGINQYAKVYVNTIKT